MSYYAVELTVGMRRMCAVPYMKGEKWGSMVENGDYETERGKGDWLVITFWANLAPLNGIATDTDKIFSVNTFPDLV